MVNVLIVEQGRQLCTVSTALPVSEVFSLVVNETDIPEDEVLIFNSEGVLLDMKQELAAQTLEDSDLFVIHSNSVNCVFKPLVREENWQDFTKFPAGFRKEYSEPYSSEGIDTVEAKNVLEEERLLFSLTQRAKQTYALYCMHLGLYEEVKIGLDIRAKACPVLLKSIKLYYRQIKYIFDRVSGKLEKLKVESLLDAQSYKSRLKDLLRQEHLADYVHQLLRDPTVKQYGKRFAGAIRTLENKLSEVETLLTDAKKSIREKMNKAKNRASTLARFVQVYERSGISMKEPVLAQNFGVFAVYKKLREKLNKALRTSALRLDTGLTDSDDEIGAYQEKIENGERILARLDEFGRQEKEESTRIAVIFREVVAECAEKASRLKLRGKDKLEKIEKKIEELEKGREMLEFPRKFPNSCEAAMCEIERRRATGLYLVDMYTELSRAILAEAARREEFIRVHGALLPAQVFPELESATLPKSVLQRLLKVDDHEEDSGVSLFGQLDDKFKRAILYYEGQLKQAEQRRVHDIGTLEKQCAVLEREIQELSQLVSRTSGDMKEMHAQVSTCSSELGKLREVACGSQLRQLKAEVEKVQKKEAAFKEGWVEQVQALESEVRTLRTRERKRSRPDVANLP